MNPLDVECPTCGVEPHEYCVDPIRFASLPYFHVARKDAVQDRAKPKSVYDVACPRCKAEIKVPCLDPTNRPMTLVHPDRCKAALNGLNYENETLTVAISRKHLRLALNGALMSALDSVIGVGLREFVDELNRLKKIHDL